MNVNGFGEWRYCSWGKLPLSASRYNAVKNRASLPAGTIKPLLLVTMLSILVGCGMRQPIYQPMPRPVGQPIFQPMPQPIGYPIGYPGPPGQPIGQPISYPDSGVFSLSGTASQQEIVRAAIARCTFPFDRLRPGLQRKGFRGVNIKWESMGKGTLGWASTGAEIGISTAISGIQAHRTTILELGHIVDFFYMTPEMREKVTKLWHPNAPDNHEWFGSTEYWDRNGEAFSALFLWAFADEELWFDAGYSHKPSRELAVQLREILIPGSAVPVAGQPGNVVK